MGGRFCSVEMVVVSTSLCWIADDAYWVGDHPEEGSGGTGFTTTILNVSLYRIIQSFYNLSPLHIREVCVDIVTVLVTMECVKLCWSTVACVEIVSYCSGHQRAGVVTVSYRSGHQGVRRVATRHLRRPVLDVRRPAVPRGVLPSAWHCWQPTDGVRRLRPPSARRRGRRLPASESRSDDGQRRRRRHQRADAVGRRRQTGHRRPRRRPGSRERAKVEWRWRAVTGGRGGRGGGYVVNCEICTKLTRCVCGFMR